MAITLTRPTRGRSSAPTYQPPQCEEEADGPISTSTPVDHSRETREIPSPPQTRESTHPGGQHSVSSNNNDVPMSDEYAFLNPMYGMQEPISANAGPFPFAASNATLPPQFLQEITAFTVHQSVEPIYVSIDRST